METISLSMHPNDTHPYIEQNHEPKNLNLNSYQVVAHFYVGEGRGPLHKPHLLVMYLLSFVLFTCIAFTCKFVPLSFVLFTCYLNL